MYRKIEIYSKFNDDISYHFQVFVDTYFEQAFTRLCFFRSIEKYTQMKFLCCKFQRSEFEQKNVTIIRV